MLMLLSLSVEGCNGVVRSLVERHPVDGRSASRSLGVCR